MRGYRVATLLTICVFAAVCVALAVPVLGTQHSAAADDGPQAEAGLDQRVYQGAVVALDAGGSVAPDGEIVAYNWTIRGPDNTTAPPDCPTCEQTEFQPSRTGTYQVSITVRDDSNRTATDTMYVEVLPHDPPNATITGPDRIQSNETAELRFQASGGDAPLQSIALYRDTTLLRGHLVNGTYDETLSVDSPDPGVRRFELLAVDAQGNTRTAIHNLTVRPVPAYFAVEITDTTEIGDELEVDLKVSNVGGRNDTQTVRLCRGNCRPGRVVDDLGRVSLDPGEDVSLTATWPGWDGERGEILVTAETDDDRDVQRIIRAEPSHLTISGLPAEMAYDTRANVTTVLHYDNGASREVTAEATYTTAQSERHSYLRIPDQRTYDPLTVEAVATKSDPDSNGEATVIAEYEDLTAEATTTILPECEVTPDADTCSDSPGGGWEDYSGNGRGEFRWRLQGADSSGGTTDYGVPEQIQVGELVDLGVDEAGSEITIDVLLYDYVELDGVNRESVADPDRDYTSRAETRLNDYRVRTPGYDERVWAWTPGYPWPENPFLAGTGNWGVEWDRYSSLVGSEGQVEVQMGRQRPLFLKGESPGATEICFSLTINSFQPRDGGSYECSEVEITERDDGGGVGDPGP